MESETRNTCNEQPNKTVELVDIDELIGYVVRELGTTATVSFNPATFCEFSVGRQSKGRDMRVFSSFVTDEISLETDLSLQPGIFEAAIGNRVKRLSVDIIPGKDGTVLPVKRGRKRLTFINPKRGMDVAHLAREPRSDTTWGREKSNGDVYGWAICGFGCWMGKASEYCYASPSDLQGEYLTKTYREGGETVFGKLCNNCVTNIEGDVEDAV